MLSTFSIRFGRSFLLETTQESLTLRLPGIGEAFLCRGLSAWSSWAELRREWRTEDARLAVALG